MVQVFIHSAQLSPLHCTSEHCGDFHYLDLFFMTWKRMNIKLIVFLMDFVFFARCSVVSEANVCRV